MSLELRLNSILLCGALGALAILPAYAEDIATYHVDLTQYQQSAKIRIVATNGRAISSLRPLSDDAEANLIRASIGGLKLDKGRLLASPGESEMGYSVALPGNFKAWLLGNVLSDARLKVVDLRDWFWVPMGWESDDSIVLVFELPEGVELSVPWEPIETASGRSAYRARPIELERRSTMGLGSLIVDRVIVGGSVVSIASATGTVRRADSYTHWVMGVAESAVHFFGGLPVSQIQILVMPTWASTDAVPLGEIRRGSGNGIVLVVGKSASEADLRSDWTLYHEFVHLSHPYLGAQGRWLAEGFASYHQYALMSQAGVISEQDAWQRLIQGFQRGEKSTTPGKTVFDDSLMRTYWAGAVMALELDLRLRDRSDGKLTLAIAMARFSKCCLPAYNSWQPDDYLSRLDELNGTSLFVTLYERYSTKTSFPDYQALLQEFGLGPKSGDLPLASTMSTRK